MAKEQSLSLNPTKISGVCGRLMCCLKFEEDHYETTRKKMPKLGKEAETPEGVGTVTDLNILKETVTVRLTKGDATELKTFPLEEIKWQKPQQNQEGRSRNPEGRSRRSRASRPAISSNLDEPAPTPAEDPELPGRPVRRRGNGAAGAGQRLAQSRGRGPEGFGGKRLISQRLEERE